MQSAHMRKLFLQDLLKTWYIHVHAGLNHMDLLCNHQVHCTTLPTGSILVHYSQTGNWDCSTGGNRSAVQ